MNNQRDIIKSIAWVAIIVVACFFWGVIILTYLNYHHE